MEPWELFADNDGPWSLFSQQPGGQPPLTQRRPVPAMPDPRAEQIAIMRDPNAMNRQAVPFASADPVQQGVVEQFAQEPARLQGAVQSETFGDFERSVASGIGSGAAGVADLPAFGMDMLARGLGGLGNTLGLDGDMMRQSMTGALPGPSPTRDFLNSVTGDGLEYQPQSTANEYVQTVSEFLPGALAMGPGGVARNALQYGVVPGIASEAAGQATEGSALEPWARMGAAIAAPLGVSGIEGMMRGARAAAAPTVAALRSQADDLYDAARAMPDVPPTEVASLRSRIDTALTDASRITPTGRVLADGNIRSFLDVVDDFNGQPMSASQAQNLRTFLQDAAKSADAGERRIGTILLGQFDDWRGQHWPDFRQADVLYGRAQRAADVDWRIDRAERRAASTGTGGNAVNAARQNIRAILDNPRLRRGYSPAEISAMEQVVRGTSAVNVMRLISRLSPTSGGMPLMLNSLAGAGGIATQNPLFAAPAIAGWAAQGASEVMTGNQINALSQLIRRGAALPPSSTGPSGIPAAVLNALAVSGGAPE